MGAFKRLADERPCVLAIDPGTTSSAYVVYCEPMIIEHAIVENQELLDRIRFEHFNSVDHLAIEMISSYGMTVGAEVFRTCVWIGRFEEAWGEPYSELLRRDVKLHVCASPRAKDANIRQALLDRFGARGTKAKPGATYGLRKDEWQALAVAVTWSDGRLSHAEQ